MTGYADPELLLAGWLHELLACKMYADPRLQANWWAQAPIGHVQRAPGEGDTALTLDSALIDLDFYGKIADQVRAYAEQARYELRVNLRLHTFASGVLCTDVFTVTAPFWAPDPSVFRRSATYRVMLAGMTA